MPYTARLRLETVGGTGLRFKAAVGSGGAITVDTGAAPAGPGPMELVLAALGGCTAMDVISILRKMRQGVAAYEIEVNGKRRDEHPRVFTRIEVVHRVRGRNLDAKAIAHAIELSEAKYCSVHAMLSPAVAISSRYELEPMEALLP